MQRCKDCGGIEELEECDECGELICKECFYENDGLCEDCKEILHEVLVDVYGKEVIEGE